MTEKIFGFMDLNAQSSDQNAMMFLIRQMMRNDLLCATIARVSSVSDGLLDVVPLVSQVTPSGQAIPHGTVHSVPYTQAQAGACLVRLTPVPGDIGIIVFADRDITRIVARHEAAAPQTLRAHDWSDAMYVGTLWAASSPEHVIDMGQDGITITSPQPVRVNGSLDVSGDVTAGGISLKTHIHPGVQSGSSSTGEPE